MDDGQTQQRRREQQAHIQEQLQNRHRIQHVFARYGGDACRVIWEELRRHQGLQPVLQRLGLPAASSLDEELEVLQRFLNEHGSGPFMQRVRPHRDAKLDWDIFSTPAETGGHPVSSNADTVVATPTPAPRKTQRPLTQEMLGPAALTPPDWLDSDGRYIGPERRKHADRRMGRDRREQIDSISRNKRYGGDRRKSRGRRKNDSRD